MNIEIIDTAKQVFDLTRQRKTYDEIAEELNISRSTVRNIKNSTEYLTIKADYSSHFFEVLQDEYREGLKAIRAAMPDATAKLIELAQSENQKIALDAVKELRRIQEKAMDDSKLDEIDRIKLAIQLFEDKQ